MIDPSKLTEKTQGALQEAQAEAVRRSHQEVASVHLLWALVNQAEGIVPDILLGNVHLTKGEQSTTRLKEADLAGHLINPEEAENGKARDKKKASTDEEDPIEDDYALSEALNLLKGLAILRPHRA